MNSVTINDFGSSINIYLVNDEEYITLQHDDFSGFTFSENMDGLKDMLTEKELSSEVIAEILDKVENWVYNNSNI